MLRNRTDRTPSGPGSSFYAIAALVLATGFALLVTLGTNASAQEPPPPEPPDITVPICVAKIVEPTGYVGGARPGDVSFELRIEDTVEPAPAFTPTPSAECGEFDLDEGQPADSVAFTEFAVAPDQEVTIAELVSDGSLGVRDAECSHGDGPFDDDEPIIDDGDDGTEQAFVRAEVGPLFCEFVNDGAIVCVAKLVTPTALMALDDVQADDFDFTVTLRDGTPLTTLDGEIDMTATPNDECAGLVPAPNGQAELFRYGQFTLAHLTRFTISETGPEGAARSVGPTIADCSRVDAELAAARLAEAEPLVEAIEPEPIIGSANGRARLNRAPLTCLFVNDVVRVCLAKLVTPNALEASDLVASDFDFDVTLRDGTVLHHVDGELDMTSNPTRDCALPFPPEPAEATAFAEVFLPPDTRFSITETPVTGPVGPALSFCESDIFGGPQPVGAMAAAAEPGDVIERLPGAATVNGVARPGEGPVFCIFVNDAIRVCVANVVGSTALEGGHVAGDFDFALTLRDGMPLGALDGEIDMTDEPADGCDTHSLPPNAVAGAEVRHGRFYVAPGTKFTLTETPPNDGVGPIFSECTSNPRPFAPRLSTSVFGNTNDDDAVQCTFLNDSLRVCVATQILPTALDAPNNFSTADYDFDITRRSGTVIDHLDGEVDMSEAAVPDGCVPVRGPTIVRYGVAHVKPGTLITAVQSPIDGPIGPVTSFCETFVPLVGARAAAEPGDVIDIPAGAASANGQVPAAFDASVQCFFANDSVRVCVSKHVRATGRDAGFLPADFSFDLTTREGEPIASAAGTEAAADPTEPCAYRNFPAPPEAWGHHEFFVAPNERITVTETGAADGAIGSVRSRCSQPGANAELLAVTGDVAPVVLDPSSTTVAMANGQAIYGSGPVICEFANDSVRVCAVKTLGQGAIDAGATVGDFGIGLAVGTNLSPISTPTADMPACGEPLDGEQNGYVEFFAPPGVLFLVSEMVPPDVPVGLVQTSCTQAGADVTAATGVPNAVSGIGSAARPVAPVLCSLVNDAARVCVAKSLGATAVEAGVLATDATISITASGAVVEKTPAVISDACAEAGTPSADGHVEFFVTPGSTFALAEEIADGVPAGLVALACDDTPGDPAATPAITATAEGALGAVNICTMENDTVRVTINKDLINDGVASEFTSNIEDFIFEVFDGDGAQLFAGSDTDPGEMGFTFFAAPNQTLTLSEQPRTGYQVTEAACDVGDAAGVPVASPSIELVLPAAAATASCSFVNDDIPLVPICATQTLLPGASGFDLSDMGIELFKDGELIADATGADDGSLLCAEIAAAGASPEAALPVLAGNQVLLANVLPDGSPYTLVQTFPAEAGARLQSVSADCALVGAGAAQVLVAAEVVFTPTSSTTRVVCTLAAEATAIPTTVTVETVNTGSIMPSDIVVYLTDDATGDRVASGPGPVLTIADLPVGSYTVHVTESKQYVVTEATCDGSPGTSFTVENTDVAGATCKFTVEGLSAFRSDPVVPPAESDESASPATAAAGAVAPTADVINLTNLATTGSSSNVAVSLGLLLMGIGASAAGVARGRRPRW